MAEGVKTKTCRLCGQDCSDRARIRDPKGRYYCRTCYVVKAREVELQRRADAESPPGADVPQVVDPSNVLGADPGWSAVGDSLGDSGMHADAPSAMLACPGCGAPAVANAVVCVECGYNTTTGQKLHTISAKPGRTVRSFPGTTRGLSAMALSPPGVAMALLAFFGILFALGLGSDGTAMVFVVATFVFSVAIGLLVLVMAFMHGILHGIATLFVPFYALIWVYAFNENAYIKWLYFVSILAVVGMFILVAGMSAGDFALEGLGR